MEAKQTPLYDAHLRANARMVEFAGWMLPVQYEGIMAEHMAVRQQAGLFDVSHMGEVAVQGVDALPYLNHLLTNDFTSLEPGAVRYSPMCYADGGTVDDVLVYMLAQGDYLVVVNASNREKDVAWMQEHILGNVSVEDVSDAYAQIALQGPAAASIMAAFTADIPASYYTFLRTTLLGAPCFLSRTGYTGEDGFEIYCPPAAAISIWDALLSAGAPHGIKPCGLGARDTLRLEAAMPLYGHELGEDITPLMAGLGRFVKLEKSFIGRDALAAQKAEGLPSRRCGIRLTGRGIAREGAAVLVDGQVVGSVSSGTKAPYLNEAIAMAYIRPESIVKHGPCEVEVRSTRIPAQFTPMPFYKKQH